MQISNEAGNSPINLFGKRLPLVFGSQSGFAMGDCRPGGKSRHRRAGRGNGIALKQNPTWLSDPKARSGVLQAKRHSLPELLFIEVLKISIEEGYLEGLVVLHEASQQICFIPGNT